MDQFVVAGQHVELPECFHDGRIGLEHVLPGKRLDLVRETSVIIDRYQDLQRFGEDLPLPGRVVFRSQQIVIHPMTRRDMHAPGSLFQGHEVAKQNRRKPLAQGSLTAKALESVTAFHATEDLRVFQLTGFGHLFDQFFRHDQDFVADAYEHIVDFRMHRDRLIRRKRPGRRRPNDDGDFLDSFEVGTAEPFP